MGAKYVLVIKRDRLGHWWRRKNGFVRGQIWEGLGEDVGKAFERLSDKAGLLDSLEDIPE